MNEWFDERPGGWCNSIMIIMIKTCTAQQSQGPHRATVSQD